MKTINPITGWEVRDPVARKRPITDHRRIDMPLVELYHVIPHIVSPVYGQFREDIERAWGMY